MTGIGRYMVELVGALANSPISDEWRFDVSGPREPNSPSWLPQGFGYRPVPIGRAPLRVTWAAADGPALERLIGRFDLVHAMHPSSPLPTKRPSVVTFHDVMPIEHPDWYGPGVGWAARRALAQIAANGNRVIADSKYTADLVAALGGVSLDRISVVHLAVGPDFRRPVPQPMVDRVCARYGVEAGKYLLAVGNIATRKNLGILVRALALMPPEGPRLVLCGHARGDEVKVRAEIDRLALADRVIMTGFVPDRELPAMMSGALALVQPSIDEGFGLSPLEAMALGIPVVASRAGSHPEIVGESGLLVDPSDPTSWAGAIGRLWDDADLRKTLAAAGRERAAEFTWQRAAAETVVVYRAALDE